MSTPLFSIVTATYNAQAFLEETMQSILSQSFTDFEYLIIDGGSRDNTIEIVKKFEVYPQLKWISEKDKGIYDAWNKGVKMAKGKWIIFLGADDIMAENALKEYYEFLQTQKQEMEYVCSKLVMITDDRKPLREKGCPWVWKEFRIVNHLAHPGSLHNRSLFDKYGLYNIKYKITGDYELLLRPGDKLKAAFLNKVTVYMREGGTSGGYKALREHREVMINTGKVKKSTANFYFWFFKLKMAAKNLLRAANINVYMRKSHK